MMHDALTLQAKENDSKRNDKLSKNFQIILKMDRASPPGEREGGTFFRRF